MQARHLISLTSIIPVKSSKFILSLEKTGFLFKQFILNMSNHVIYCFGSMVMPALNSVYRSSNLIKAIIRSNSTLDLLHSRVSAYPPSWMEFQYPEKPSYWTTYKLA